MKTMKTSILLMVAFFVLGSMDVFAQGRHRGGGHPKAVKTKVVVKPAHKHRGAVIVRSKYRPAKVVVYHPYWGPKRVYHHRWVYFPRHNFYWDNWRGMYYFWNGTIWLSQVAPPPAVVNINIDNEKSYELKDSEDDIDDIYQTNGDHKKDYKEE